jgi:hypothetical protein
MVANSGEAIRSETVKPVNLPELVNVEEDAAGQPAAVRLAQRQKVAAITDRWRIDDEW